MALAQTEIEGDLWRACARRTGFKRQLKQTFIQEDRDHIEKVIKETEETIARLQGLPPPTED
jgi:hypothetical protein